jgi:MFS transporter, AAHS family, benzoate transport protein
VGKDRPVAVFEWLDTLGFNRFHALLLILSGITLAFAGYDLQIAAYVVPQFLRGLKLPPMGTGLLLSSGFLGFMIGAVCYGVVADRIGRKKALILAVSMFSGLSGLTAIASTYLAFCVLRFLAGIGIGGAFSVIVTMLVEFAPPRTRATVLTAAMGGFSLGWSLAALTALQLMPYGWRLPCLLGGLPLLYVPALQIYLPESVRFLAAKGRHEEVIREMRRIEKIVRSQPRDWTGAASVKPPAKPERVGTMGGMRSSLATMTILIWFTYFFTTTTLYGLSTWLQSLMVAAGISLAAGHFYGMLQGVGAALGVFLIGCLLDFTGRKKGLIIAYSVSGLSLILFGVASSNTYLLCLAAMIGLLMAGAPAALNVLVGEIYPTAIRCRGVGWTQAVTRAGAILGPIAGGLGRTLGLGFAQFFLFLALPCLICIVLVSFYRVEAKGQSLEAINASLLR